jgi:hypothetical protein
MNTNDIGWIGHYGNMLLAMPKEHNPDRFTFLLFEERLKEYLLAQDKFISERIWGARKEKRCQRRPEASRLAALGTGSLFLPEHSRRGGALGVF